MWVFEQHVDGESTPATSVRKVCVGVVVVVVVVAVVVCVCVCGGEEGDRSTRTTDQCSMPCELQTNQPAKQEKNKRRRKTPPPPQTTPFNNKQQTTNNKE